MKVEFYQHSGALYDLLVFSLDEKWKVRLYKAIGQLGISSFKIKIADTEYWLKLDNSHVHSQACTNPDVPNTIWLNEDYWLKAIRQDNGTQIVGLGLEICFYHESLHLVGYEHGSKMCKRVCSYIDRMNKNIKPAGATTQAEIDEWFEYQKVQERKYNQR